MWKRIMSYLGANKQENVEQRRLFKGYGGFPSSRAMAHSGTNVTANTAMNHSAAWACIKVITETIATLPINVYQRDSTGNREIMDKSTLFKLLHRAPNKDMTSVQFFEAMMYNLLLHGNSYTQIIRRGNGEIFELFPLHSEYMKVDRNEDTGNIEYVYRNEHKLSQEEVLHIGGLSSNGIVGFSPLTVARQVLGLGLSIDEQAGSFFANGAIPSGVLEHPGKLSDAAADNLRSSWSTHYGGSGNAYKTALLEEGLTYKPIAFNAADSQLLESRKFQVSEIARIFRVPPHMIQDLERATFSNIEAQSIDFVRHTIRPWLVRIESAINMRLLRNSPNQFVEFNVDGLLRGDTTTRYEAYAKGLQNGFLTPNEVRRLENFNTTDSEGGDVFYRPLNMHYVSPDGSVVDAPNVQEEPTIESDDVVVSEDRAALTEVQPDLGKEFIQHAQTKFCLRLNKFLDAVESREQFDAENFKLDLAAQTFKNNPYKALAHDLTPVLGSNDYSFNYRNLRNLVTKQAMKVVDNCAPGTEITTVRALVETLSTPKFLTQYLKKTNEQ